MGRPSGRSPIAPLRSGVDVGVTVGSASGPFAPVLSVCTGTPANGSFPAGFFVPSGSVEYSSLWTGTGTVVGPPERPGVARGPAAFCGDWGAATAGWLEAAPGPAGAEDAEDADRASLSLAAAGWAA